MSRFHVVIISLTLVILVDSIAVVVFGSERLDLIEVIAITFLSAWAQEGK